MSGHELNIPLSKSVRETVKRATEVARTSVIQEARHLSAIERARKETIETYNLGTGNPEADIDTLHLLMDEYPEVDLEFSRCLRE